METKHSKSASIELGQTFLSSAAKQYQEGESGKKRSD